MQAATLMYEPIPELLSFVASQWCLYSRFFHAGGLDMRNFLCGFHSYLRQTSFSSTGNLQSQFLHDNIHSIVHQSNSLLYLISASCSGPCEICLNQTFYHSTFMLCSHSGDWGIFGGNFGQMYASESWFFWSKPSQPHFVNTQGSPCILLLPTSFSSFAVFLKASCDTSPIVEARWTLNKGQSSLCYWFDLLKMESNKWNGRTTNECQLRLHMCGFDKVAWLRQM